MKVYAFTADGMEEVECLAVCDILKRAGIEVELVSITDELEITGSHGFHIRADRRLSEIADDAELLFLPGGGAGTERLAASEPLAELLKAHAASGRRLAAICAAPSVLGGLGLLAGHKATCYPGFEDKLTGAEYTGENVVTDRLISTGRGMGCSTLLGLELVRVLKDPETARELAQKIQFPGCFSGGGML